MEGILIEGCVTRKEMEATHLLSLSEVYVNYGIVEILNDITLSVKERQIVSRLGANGSGKTSLLNAISGLVKPKKGRTPSIFRTNCRSRGIKESLLEGN